MSCPQEIPLNQPSGLVIDGQAVVMALGKPNDAHTFGQYADEFVKFILKEGQANTVELTSRLIATGTCQLKEELESNAPRNRDQFGA